MSFLNEAGARSRGRFAALLLVVVLAGLAVAMPAQSEAKKKKGVNAKVTVMTRNVYLGGNLRPLLDAENLGEAVDLAGDVYNEVERTNFPERAVPLAKEIRASKADLVGLQEVAHWQEGPLDGGGPPISPIGEPATETKYDFLDELMSRLGGKYKVVAVQEEFAGELPANIDGNPGAELDARLTMRDVILQRKGSKVKAKKGTVEQDHYDELLSASIGGLPLDVLRGWQSVDAVYKKKGKGKKAKTKKYKFRFVNIHLEAYGGGLLKEAQAIELTKKGGPLKTKKPVVLVGDLNSGLLDPHGMGDGGTSGTDEDQLAFKALKQFGMKDRGAVHTCCYGSALDITEDPFDHTVDHVLTNKKARSKRLKAYVTGDDPKEITPSGLWPSDHGGVVSKLKLRK